VATSLTSLSDTAIVLSVIVGAFTASWIHSGRTHRRPASAIVLPVRSVGSQAA
jgi:hypothetical protein